MSEDPKGETKPQGEGVIENPEEEMCRTDWKTGLPSDADQKPDRIRRQPMRFGHQEGLTA